MLKILKKFHEYQIQKRLVRQQYHEISMLYDEMVAAHSAISRHNRLDTPEFRPQIWGQAGYPCEAVHEKNVDLDPFVLDYNIAYAGPEYVFYCPFYNMDEPCNFNCCYAAANSKYFDMRAKYDRKMAIYEKNATHLQELRDKFWGRNKNK